MNNGPNAILKTSTRKVHEPTLSTHFWNMGDRGILTKAPVSNQVGGFLVREFRVDGFELPLQLVVGPAEAMAVLTAVQERKSRRPLTHEAWGLSLAAVGWKVRVDLNPKSSSSYVFCFDPFCF